MAGKIEKCIDHIAQLGPGEKVSVRSLAQALGVSEGTAYKSIKAAEAQGLVITRPKVGTVRINLRDGPIRGTTLSEAARSVGAACLCGPEEAMVKRLPMPVLGDGSLEQFEHTVRRSGDAVFCVVGDRPEIQKKAVELGCDLLLTGGAVPEKRLLRRAEQKGLSVFVSEQDSSTLLGMLRRRMSEELPRREMSEVRDWMQLPRYLYHDDMVTEWHRLYSDIFFEGSSCAVVDDNLRICGMVDATTAMSAPPALRLSEIMDAPELGAIVREDMQMGELANRMIANERFFTAVTSGEGMSGYISLADVVRYYQYNQTYREFDRNEEGILRLNADEPESQRRTFTVTIRAPGEETNRSHYINFMTFAAAWHGHDLYGRPVNFDNGTFFSMVDLTEPGDYIISSEVMKQKGDSLILELEMFDNNTSYIKCTFGVHASADKKTPRGPSA